MGLGQKLHTKKVIQSRQGNLAKAAGTSFQDPVKSTLPDSESLFTPKYTGYSLGGSSAVSVRSRNFRDFRNSLQRRATNLPSFSSPDTSIIPVPPTAPRGKKFQSGITSTDFLANYKSGYFDRVKQNKSIESIPMTPEQKASADKAAKKEADKAKKLAKKKDK